MLCGGIKWWTEEKGKIGRDTSIWMSGGVCMLVHVLAEQSRGQTREALPPPISIHRATSKRYTYISRQRQKAQRTWLRSRSAAALASASLRFASPSLPPMGPFPLPPFLPLRRHVPCKGWVGCVLVSKRGREEEGRVFVRCGRCYVEREEGQGTCVHYQMYASTHGYVQCK